MNQSTALAREINLKPSVRKILSHLKERETISPVEALVSHGISRLAAAIYELRQEGWDISTEMRKDASGHPYARYRLIA